MRMRGGSCWMCCRSPLSRRRLISKHWFHVGLRVWLIICHQHTCTQHDYTSEQIRHGQCCVTTRAVLSFNNLSRCVKITPTICCPAVSLLFILVLNLHWWFGCETEMWPERKGQTGRKCRQRSGHEPDTCGTSSGTSTALETHTQNTACSYQRL